METSHARAETICLQRADDPASHRCHGNQALSKRPILMESIEASVYLSVEWAWK